MNSYIDELQETEGYQNIVRQHLDLETIQTRMENGLYSSCSSSSANLHFYRDLLLLFNNAIVFFPKSSTELLAARELRSLVSKEIRSLVSKEMKKETQKSDSAAAQHGNLPQPKSEPERSDSSFGKHKSSAPLIVCRKRSSMSGKPSQSTKTEQQQESNDSKPASDIKPTAFEQSLLKMGAQDRPVTGTRSSRRSNKTLAESSNTSRKQNASSSTKASATNKQETPKPETKRTEALLLDKKRSAVDFLKRIKKNSPVEPVTKKKNNNNKGRGSGGGQVKRDSGKKVEKGKERVLRKNSERKKVEEHNKRRVARPGKKMVESSRGSVKRGRESSGKEAPKRPRKRSRM